MTPTAKGMRYMSGLFVFDERIVLGQPVIGYMNAAGQIWNEAWLSDEYYIPSETHLEEPVYRPSFRLSANGQALDCGWSVCGASCSGDSAVLELEHASAPVRVALLTRAAGEGWLVRSLRITNTGEEYLPLDRVDPLAGAPWIHKLTNIVSSYSAQEILPRPGAPYFEVGYYADNRFMHEGDFRFAPVTAEPLLIDSGMHGRSGWSRPSIVLRDNLNGSLFCAELAYSGSWRAQLRAGRMPERTFADFSLGLACPAGQSLRVLAPGESVLTPEVHFTLCASGPEALMQSEHRYIRSCIMPQEPPELRCPVEANHRGYLADRENEADILRDVELAAGAGVELYVIDAGWFGREPNVWFDNAGDWHAGDWLPHDLDPVIDRVHEKGMRFGLWVEPEAAGANSALARAHPEWIMPDTARGRALDLSLPDAARWVEAQLADIIGRYRLDLFRLDHNHRIGAGAARLRGPFPENNLWRYYDSLYAILGSLRRRFPHVSFQNSAAGGGRLDFGILRFFHHGEMSDWMHTPRVQRVFRGLSLTLPPETLLQCFGMEVGYQVMKGDLLFQLHSVLGSSFILRGIAPPEDEPNPLLLQEIRRVVALYRSKLRPVLRSGCLMHHHTPVQKGIMDPEPWLAYELSDPEKTAGYALIFRLGETPSPRFTLHPQLVPRNGICRVTLDRACDSFECRGQELREAGITVTLDHHFSSELVYWELL